MANGFGALIFTVNGLNLLAKAEAGTQLQFTRIAVGDGILNGQDATKFTHLLDEVLSLNITSKIVSGATATLTSVLDNSTLSTGFYWREIGVFATDPQLGEILYAYVNAGDGDIYVPDKTTNSFSAPCNLGLYIGTAQNVTAVIDTSLVYATKDDINAIIAGTTKVGEALQADSATHAASADSAGTASVAAGYSAGGGIDTALKNKAAQSDMTAAQAAIVANVTALQGKAALSTSVYATLTAAGWTGSAAPYTQTVAVAGLGAAQNVLIGIAPAATDAQRAAAASAMLGVSVQATGSLTIIAEGIKPTVDIPVAAVLLG